MTRVAVIGHIEWVTFADGAVPAPGEISLLSNPFSAAAGAGAVVAVELAREQIEVLFYTALGDDAAGDESLRFLEERGVQVRAARQPQPQTQALTILSPDHERTIMVIGENLHPQATDDLGWVDVATVDAVYFTGGDPATLVLARSAPILVVTARRLAVLARSGVRADVLIGSATDPGEQIGAVTLAAVPAIVVQTHGRQGGSWTAADGARGTWPSVALPGPARDAYGAGDSFHAALTGALAAGKGIAEAVDAGARAGAAAVTRRGAYGE
jgi:ribokinase